MRLNFLLACVLCWFVTACQINSPPKRPSDEAVLAENSNFSPFVHQIDGQQVYGVQVAGVCDAAVLFIHGTPGGWGLWSSYMSDDQLQSKATLISIDRPGFGESLSETSLTSIQDQAHLILQSALLQHPGPFILVGHSYGGPIQLQMAMDTPDSVSSMIILAGPADPKLHHSRWYHYLGGTWLGRQFTSGPMEVATDEMLALQDNLEAQFDRLGSISVKTTAVQGGKDWLVPPGNTDYMRQNLTAADVEVIELPEQNHFLPRSESALVKRKLLEHLGEQSCIH